MNSQRRERALLILVRDINEKLRRELSPITYVQTDDGEKKIYPADTFRAAGMPMAALFTFDRQDEYLMGSTRLLHKRLIEMERGRKMHPLEEEIRQYNELEERKNQKPDGLSTLAALNLVVGNMTE